MPRDHLHRLNRLALLLPIVFLGCSNRIPAGAPPAAPTSQTASLGGTLPTTIQVPASVGTQIEGVFSGWRDWNALGPGEAGHAGLNVGWIRVPINWSSGEVSPGNYQGLHDRLDVLFQSLPPGVNAIVVLLYPVPSFYGSFSNGGSGDWRTWPDDPTRDIALRAHFADFASEAVRYYSQTYQHSGHAVVWEIWNEPNYVEWNWGIGGPKSYAALARTAAQSMKNRMGQLGVNQSILVGAMAWMDSEYIARVMEAAPDLLGYADGVSVHPYRYNAPQDNGVFAQGNNPETVAEHHSMSEMGAYADSYGDVRDAFAPYVPIGKSVPLVESEMGYWYGTNLPYGPGGPGTIAPNAALYEAAYLSRIWLTNIWLGVPISITYPWTSADSKNPGGYVAPHFDDVAGDWWYDTEYTAFAFASHVTSELQGFRYVGREPQDSSSDFVLGFWNGREYKLAIWTTAAPHWGQIALPGSSAQQLDMWDDPSSPIVMSNQVAGPGRAAPGKLWAWFNTGVSYVSKIWSDATLPSFSNGFESSPHPYEPLPILQASNVVGWSGAGVPESDVRSMSADGWGIVAHGGGQSMAVFGQARGGAATWCYWKLHDFGANPLSIHDNTRLSFWVNPQEDLGRFVTVDLVLTDGTTLRDSRSLDQNGYDMHPASGHGRSAPASFKIPLDTWTQVVTNLGTRLAGRKIQSILIAFESDGAEGPFHAYVDDIAITDKTVPDDGTFP